MCVFSRVCISLLLCNCLLSRFKSRCSLSEWLLCFEVGNCLNLPTYLCAFVCVCGGGCVCIMRVTLVIMSDSSLPENTPKKTHRHAHMCRHTQPLNKRVRKFSPAQMHVYKQTHMQTFSFEITTHTSCCWQMKPRRLQKVNISLSNLFWLIALFVKLHCLENSVLNKSNESYNLEHTKKPTIYYF